MSQRAAFGGYIQQRPSPPERAHNSHNGPDAAAEGDGHSWLARHEHEDERGTEAPIDSDEEEEEEARQMYGHMLSRAGSATSPSFRLASFCTRADATAKDVRAWCWLAEDPRRVRAGHAGDPARGRRCCSRRLAV